MTEQHKSEAPPKGPTLTGEQARQGEIILKTPTRKAIFIGGLVLAALLGVFGFLFLAP